MHLEPAPSATTHPRPRRRTAALLLLAACAVAPVTAQEPETFAPTWRGIAAQLRRELEANGVVGGAVWFLHGDKVLSREFHGFADLAENRRVDAGTIFHWASVTKTFTGISLMQLKVRGKLRSTDPIVDHLPELNGVHGGDWAPQFK